MIRHIYIKEIKVAYSRERGRRCGKEADEDEKPTKEESKDFS